MRVRKKKEATGYQSLRLEPATPPADVRASRLRTHCIFALCTTPFNYPLPEHLINSDWHSATTYLVTIEVA
jgi:hypothetical protein